MPHPIACVPPPTWALPPLAQWFFLGVQELAPEPAPDMALANQPLVVVSVTAWVLVDAWPPDPAEASEPAPEIA